MSASSELRPQCPAPAAIDPAAPFDLYLASTSPQRAQLLHQIGLRFQLVEGAVEERRLSGETPPAMARRLAVAKAEAGFRRLQGGGDLSKPVLGADTLVVHEGRVLGKPADRQDALDMLCRLSGSTHRVISAVALRVDGGCRCTLSETLVTFRNLPAAAWHQYVESGEPMGRAGSYAIQGRAACFVEGILGSYTGVVGLPLSETSELLATAGIHCLGALR